MRKNLVKLTGVLLIGGASSIALAMPASAASVPDLAVKTIQSPGLRVADTSTGTSTGTSALLGLTASVVTATFATLATLAPIAAVVK
jgi:hypothetical protein